MNPTMRFYELVLSFAGWEHSYPPPIEKADGLCRRLIAQGKVSWAINGTSVYWIAATCAEQLVHMKERSDQSEFSIRWNTVCSFLRAAFRDLSPLRQPKAMEIFHDLARKLLPGYDSGNYLFLWDRKAISRPDGSFVSNLHASDGKNFETLIRRTPGNNLSSGSVKGEKLSDCLIIAGFNPEIRPFPGS